MKTIRLTQGKFALVDDADYKDLSQYKWCSYYHRNTFYASRNIQIGKKRTTEKMHRRILGLKPGDGKFTDHRNCNGLDNRRKNLRVCTNKENIRNRTTKQRNNTSGYKGVSWNKKDKKWRGQIMVNSQYKYLGSFDFRIEAARAYNDAALKYHGEFAKTNQTILREGGRDGTL